MTKTEIKDSTTKVPTLADYKEAIEILMIDYSDVWTKTGTYEEVNEKLKELGI